MLKNLKIFDVWFFSLFEWTLAPYWSDWFLSTIVIRHYDDVPYSATLNWKKIEHTLTFANKNLRDAKIWSNFVSSRCDTVKWTAQWSPKICWQDYFLTFYKYLPTKQSPNTLKSQNVSLHFKMFWNIQTIRDIWIFTFTRLLICWCLMNKLYDKGWLQFNCWTSDHIYLPKLSAEISSRLLARVFRCWNSSSVINLSTEWLTL